jgi:hypothetical protein
MCDVVVQATHVRLCGEVDLTTTLLEEIWMEVANKFWKKKLDYKDVSFRHISCFSHGSLINFSHMPVGRVVDATTLPTGLWAEFVDDTTLPTGLWEEFPCIQL